jgi:hypothetical protein
MIKIYILLFCFWQINIYGQCSSSILFPVGTINTTPYQYQSSSWIKTTSSTSETTPNPTSIIKFDADPTNGYIELNPGFNSIPTTGAFIAQVLDGCGLLLPSKTVSNNNLVNLLEDNIKIYPNPTKDILYIKIENINEGFIEIYNILGMKIIEQKFETNSTSEINFKELSSQIFTVKITSNDQVFLSRIIKK